MLSTIPAQGMLLLLLMLTGIVEDSRPTEGAHGAGSAGEQSHSVNLQGV